MFNFLFKKKEIRKEMLPESDEERLVQKFGLAETGGQLLHTNKEKYPIRGNPQFLALKALRPLKNIFDSIVTNRLANLIPFDMSNRKLSEPVQELARVFDLFIEAHKMESNKKKWGKYKKVICVFLENDLPYRYYLQWIFERLDKNKMKLTDGDKYFFRVKNFRVDLEDEWRQALKKYPQLKGQEEEFKQFLSVDNNWIKDKDSHFQTLEELAPLFLNKNETDS